LPEIPLIPLTPEGASPVRAGAVGQPVSPR
jgi:hypothetical protein